MVPSGNRPRSSIGRGHANRGNRQAHRIRCREDQPAGSRIEGRDDHGVLRHRDRPGPRSGRRWEAMRCRVACSASPIRCLPPVWSWNPPRSPKSRSSRGSRWPLSGRVAPDAGRNVGSVCAGGPTDAPACAAVGSGGPVRLLQAPTTSNTTPTSTPSTASIRSAAAWRLVGLISLAWRGKAYSRGNGWAWAGRRGP